jgi:1,2-dihydroxy-3-keto-5-methylthiopentene dioxygenase
MTRLIAYSADNPAHIHSDSSDFAVIAGELAAIGARIERWEAAHPVGADAKQILSAYAEEIERLKRERGYTAADVVAVRPGDPNWPALRQKFLAEHTHDDDEVRYFVAGSGAFYLHVGDRVLQVIGEAGDLLSVPKGVTHWFDGGERADFTCIRVFTNPEGWAAKYSGDRIAESFPPYELVA